MKRRGRTKAANEQIDSEVYIHQYSSGHGVTQSMNKDDKSANSPCRALSLWPEDLDQAQSRLLDHYIQRFSRTYPTFSGPNNPFLSILLPLSAQSRTVLDALLALSGAQTWENGRFIYQDIMPSLRQKALRGCMNLVTRLMNAPDSNQNQLLNGDSLLGRDLAERILSNGTDFSTKQDFLSLLATCVLLILYEKLTSESGGPISAHLQFLAKIIPYHHVLAFASGPSTGVVDHSNREPFCFLSSLFLYNDLVQSTSLGIPTLSDFYLNTMPEPDWMNGEKGSPDRFYFPRLIARIGAGDTDVTDADIAAWDGSLDWFPSFALQQLEPQQNHERLPIFDPVIAFHSDFQNLGLFSSIRHWEQPNLVSELYRIAAILYRRGPSVQHSADISFGISSSSNGFYREVGNLASWAAQLIDAIPIGSPFENALLWPIGIVAKDINETLMEERKAMVAKLTYLEHRFKQKNFYLVRQHLVRQWMGDDEWLAEEDGTILFG
ncbi:unnamed protein product [Clonostachys rhizophaga]|uniref:Uncharacterized protein n=1 Tax=Clonostachys rhizophaga TaxID=160324 RepID=A0A9N9YJ86_9HYPO|nr:unnamed protein product [Clonostachys rhizophaga]